MVSTDGWLGISFLADEMCGAKYMSSLFPAFATELNPVLWIQDSQNFPKGEKNSCFKKLNVLSGGPFKKA
jgi:hypothetical protein